MEIQIEKKLWRPFEKSENNSLKVRANYLMFADIFFHLNTLQVDFFIVTAAFVNLRNSHHKIKSQNNLQLANGVPTHMFYFQEQYGGT